MESASIYVLFHIIFMVIPFTTTHRGAPISCRYGLKLDYTTYTRATILLGSATLNYLLDPNIRSFLNIFKTILFHPSYLFPVVIILACVSGYKDILL